MKYIISSLFFLATIFCYSQEITVGETEFLEKDIAARTNPRMDGNGEPCALIRVVIPSVLGMQFEGWVIGNVTYKPGEYQVWVPSGTKKISFRHSDYLPGEIVFTQPITGKCVYRVKLVAPELPKQGTKKLQTSQYLVFNVTPADAIVEVEGEIWNNNGGSARKFVPFGDYTYSVQAKDYHSSSSKVSVSDPTNKVVVDVKLLPAFGWVEIKANESNRGGTVFIDNKQIGTVPCKSDQLASGTHTVRIVKSLYGNWQQQITVEDNKTAELSPELSANFANVRLTVENNAEIWVNGEMKGKGSWSGNLSTGEYEFETKAENHRPSHVNKSLSVSKEQVVISLPAPTPIVGSLEVSTLPAMAEVFVDGEKKGETPLALKNVLIGTHKIVVRKSGYGDLSQTVELTEGATFEVKGTLSQSTTVTFQCNNPNATIFIDGENKGKIASTYDLAYGEHSIRLTALEYNDLQTTINVQPNTINSFRLNHEKKFENRMFTVNGVSFKMIAVEGGTFQMGSTSDNDYVNPPVHSVTLDKFYIGQTEVTQGLWKAVMGSNPSRIEGDNLPVQRVSWYDCQTFITELNSLTGQCFRLPTEAEWEFAAKGGNKSKGYQYSGSNNWDDVAWHKDNTRTLPKVATKSPNELGIYDMSGNVWEWCQDWYGDYSSSAQTNPAGPSSGSERVIRGGSCAHDRYYCYTPLRLSTAPTDASYYLGLRLALAYNNVSVPDKSFTANESANEVSINEISVEGVSFKMVEVKGGTFQMGSNDGARDEKPVHSVTLSSYYIGQTEVTQALWKAVMGSNPSHFKGDNLPVESVSWNDCQTFIHNLNKLTRRRFRLPTEAEWEFAAKGGNKSKGFKYSGSHNIDRVAWCTDSTHHVATKSPNELGIYDMSGNVREWCQDRYGSYSSDAQANPTGPSTSGEGFGFQRNPERVMRGWGCRMTSRVSRTTTHTNYYLGLRLAL